MISHDRVKFIVTQNMRHRDGMDRLILDCFGLKLDDTYAWDEITIICRPSQFGRFIVLRNQRGCPNGIRELKAELIPAKEQKKEYDVSRNPNKIGVVD